MAFSRACASSSQEAANPYVLVAETKVVELKNVAVAKPDESDF